MKASIIIRTYNESKHIGKLLQLCLQQKTDYPFEVIAVDSGSTDGTLDIIKNFPVQLVHINSSDFTFGRSLNYGIQSASGDYCVFTSAHCFPINEFWLNNILKPFSNEKIGMVYGKQRGDHRSKYSELQIFKKWFPEKSIPETSFAFANNANSAIRRNLWEKYHFNEELTGLEDLDWAKFLTKNNFKIAYQAEASVLHIHEETYDQVFRRYYREAIAYREIYPTQTFSFFDFAYFFIMNVASDFMHSLLDGVFLKNFYSIILFRHKQFFATYKAHIKHGKISPEMQRRLYYPRNPKWLFSGEEKSKPLAPVKIYDISRLLSSSLPTWPGSIPFTRKKLFTFEDGQHFEESELHFNTHTGTHVDAPSHFIRNGKSIDQIDLSKFCGKVYVYEYMQNKPIDSKDLAPLKKIRGLHKVLFKTLNSIKSSNSFDENFIALTPEAASELANMNIDLIGIDGNSVQLYKDKVPTTHQVLLTNEIAILEGLDLSNVQTGFYTLIALPLKIENGEGSPVRAILLEGSL